MTDWQLVQVLFTLYSKDFLLISQGFPFRVQRKAGKIRICHGDFPSTADQVKKTLFSGSPKGFFFVFSVFFFLELA